MRRPRPDLYDRLPAYLDSMEVRLDALRNDCEFRRTLIRDVHNILAVTAVLREWLTDEATSDTEARACALDACQIINELIDANQYATEAIYAEVDASRNGHSVIVTNQIAEEVGLYARRVALYRRWKQLVIDGKIPSNGDGLTMFSRIAICARLEKIGHMCKVLTLDQIERVERRIEKI